MRTRIVRIGNSQGIRIPKLLLEDSGIRDEVELKAEGNQLIIKSIEDLRQGWEALFSAKIVEPEEELKGYQTISNQWDHKEWKWE